MQQYTFHQRFTSSTFVPYICLFCHTFVKSTRPPPQYYSLPPLATTYYCNYLIRISLLLNLHIAYCAPALPLHLFQASTLPCFHIHHDQGKFVQTIASRQARHISGGEKTKQTGISSEGEVKVDGEGGRGQTARIFSHLALQTIWLKGQRQIEGNAVRSRDAWTKGRRDSGNSGILKYLWWNWKWLIDISWSALLRNWIWPKVTNSWQKTNLRQKHMTDITRNYP